MSKKVTFSEKCIRDEECPKERPHCILKCDCEEDKSIVGNCGSVNEFEKWKKTAPYKDYDYDTLHRKTDRVGRRFDPGEMGEYDIEGNFISSFTNPHYKPKRKRRDEWWKGGKKKKRTRKRRRKKRRRTRKRRRRKKRRRTRK